MFLLIGMEPQEIKLYARQLSNYTYNTIQKSIKELSYIRSFALIEVKCYNSQQDKEEEEEKRHFIQKINLGRIDFNSYKNLINT